MQLKINKPCTVYIAFDRQPDIFKLWHKKHGLYFFRHLRGLAPRIKFNICHTGVLNSNADFKIVKVVDIEIPDNLPALPPFERDAIKDFVIVDNPELTGSPARVFTKQGRIEKGSDFYKLPKPVRVFVLLHEVGHFFYGITDAVINEANKMSETDGREYIRKKRNDSEIKCDLFALIRFLKMGYNRSTAFYSLKTVLSRSQDNVKRVKELLNNIEQTQNKPL